jgi:hypothetical protein
MHRTKKDTQINACTISSAVLQEMAVVDAQNESTTASQVEQREDYQKKLEALSELQRAILVQLAPVTPLAMHSEVLREAVAPFLVARDTKGQRRELESAIAPLVRNGFVRYFCCFIDSYALGLQHANLINYLMDFATSSGNSSE